MIVIFLEGGLVQSVQSPDDALIKEPVVIVDWDVGDEEEDELFDVIQNDRTSEKAYVSNFLAISSPSLPMNQFMPQKYKQFFMFKEFKEFPFSSEKELNENLHKWMHEDYQDADRHLLDWMTIAEIGEVFNHREGTVVCIKPRGEPCF